MAVAHWDYFKGDHHKQFLDFLLISIISIGLLLFKPVVAVHLFRGFPHSSNQCSWNIYLSKQGSERGKNGLGHLGLLEGGHLSDLFGSGVQGLVGRDIFTSLSPQVRSPGSDP